MKGKGSKLWAMHTSQGVKLVSLEDLVRSASKIESAGDHEREKESNPHSQVSAGDGAESPSGSAVPGEDDLFFLSCRLYRADIRTRSEYDKKRELLVELLV